MADRLYLLIRSVYNRFTRFRNTKSNIQIAPGLQPGQQGERLPDGVIVLRLAQLSSNASETPKANAVHFTLSTDDKASELQSLTVWAKDLTPAEVAQGLMRENKAAYRLVLYLNVDNIRAIRVPPDTLEAPLDVVWDHDLRPGAEGHAGIIGLHRPDSAPRTKYKALRTKLADLATVEILPE